MQDLKEELAAELEVEDQEKEALSDKEFIAMVRDLVARNNPPKAAPKKRTGKQSKYNLFVREYIQEHHKPGMDARQTMKEAAAAWKAVSADQA